MILLFLSYLFAFWVGCGLIARIILYLHDAILNKDFSLKLDGDDLVIIVLGGLFTLLVCIKLLSAKDDAKDDFQGD